MQLYLQLKNLRSYLNIVEYKYGKSYQVKHKKAVGSYLNIVEYKLKYFFVFHNLLLVVI